MLPVEPGETPLSSLTMAPLHLAEMSTVDGIGPDANYDTEKLPRTGSLASHFSGAGPHNHDIAAASGWRLPLYQMQRVHGAHTTKYGCSDELTLPRFDVHQATQP